MSHALMGRVYSKEKRLVSSSAFKFVQIAKLKYKNLRRNTTTARLSRPTVGKSGSI